MFMFTLDGDLSVAGLDAVVFLRIFVFRLWVHCLALYIISCSACVLLYFEYKSIARMRLAHIIGSPNPSHFSILVRAIPKSNQESIGDSVWKIFTNYHGSSYLSHQVIYQTGKVQKILSNAEKGCKRFVQLKATAVNQTIGLLRYRCGLCGGTSNAFQLYCNEFELDPKKNDLDLTVSRMKEKECSAAFVFFKTRYAAVVASQLLQSSNPMLWLTDLAPEPHDVYWLNLWIPYKQLWIHRISILLASFTAEAPLFRRRFASQMLTGYLPSVLLLLFLYTVPPTMMLFSSLEGSISRSGRKKSACCKVLYLTIWNVFIVNVFSGSVLSQLNDAISSPRGLPTQLAKVVPRQNLIQMDREDKQFGRMEEIHNQLLTAYSQLLPDALVQDPIEVEVPVTGVVVDDNDLEICKQCGT